MLAMSKVFHVSGSLPLPFRMRPMASTRQRKTTGRYATALPSSLAAASSWDADLACRIWRADWARTAQPGIQRMTLGGGVGSHARPAWNGLSFEYAGEDPLLAGTNGRQSDEMRKQAQHVIGDIKHYAMNDQETGRNILNVIVSKRAMQESDLLAFYRIAIDIAKPGAVMCSYNRVNGTARARTPACSATC